MIDGVDGEGDRNNLQPAPDISSSPQYVEQLLLAIEQDYSWLLDRLSRYLRSREAAEDALHDAYLKLKAETNVGHLRHARPYLYRMAINLALNRRRQEGRMQSMDDTSVAQFPDDGPDPERVALASDEMERALIALHSLPSKRREIFLARWRDEKSQSEIAAEFGLHKRSVQKELAKAEDYLRRTLKHPRRR
jgi:RNA polymerase sigma-70 factor (ECF subfamily)